MSNFLSELEDTINQAATKIFTKLLSDLREQEEKIKLNQHLPEQQQESVEEKAFDVLHFATPYGENPSAYTQTLVINDKITALAERYGLEKIDSYGLEKLAILHKINYKSSYEDTIEGYRFKNMNALETAINEFFSLATLSDKMNYLLDKEHHSQLDEQFKNLHWVYFPETPIANIVYNEERVRKLKKGNKYSSTGLAHRDTLVLIPTNLNKPQENFYKLRLIDGFHRLLSVQERNLPNVAAFIGTQTTGKPDLARADGIVDLTPPGPIDQELEFYIPMKK